MAKLDPDKFVSYLNNILKEIGLYKEIEVLGEKLVTQGFVYSGETRPNYIFRYRIELQPELGCGLKISNIVSPRIKGSREFNKWWIRHKKKLPRVYEVEVTIFKGIRPYVHPIESRKYIIDFLSRQGYRAL